LKRAWTLPNHNVNIKQLSSHRKQVVLIGAITSKTGRHYLKYYGKYLKSNDFIDFVRVLKQKVLPAKLAIFTDNCSIHKSKKVKAYIKEENIPMVFNIPYKPEWNGIEFLWAYYKFHFRKDLLDAKVENETTLLSDIISSIETTLSKPMIKRIASKGWKNLFELNEMKIKNLQNV